MKRKKGEKRSPFWYDSLVGAEVNDILIQVGYFRVATAPCVIVSSLNFGNARGRGSSAPISQCN